MVRGLRLLTYNIQTAIPIRAYLDYVTQSWRYVVPRQDHPHILQHIGALLADHDVVALQEVDMGSVRRGCVNQAQYLAEYGAFNHWDQQTTRQWGTWVQQGNALLSRIGAPDAIERHRLPGLIPGRGAVCYRWGPADGVHLVVVMMHLALSPRARRQQWAYIVERVAHLPYVILMGDLNSSFSALSRAVPLGGFSCVELDSYPSWRPTRALDHIAVSSGLRIESARVIPCHFSDHLPVAVQIQLPPTLAERVCFRAVEQI